MNLYELNAIKRALTLLVPTTRQQSLAASEALKYVQRAIDNDYNTEIPDSDSPWQTGISRGAAVNPPPSPWTVIDRGAIEIFPRIPYPCPAVTDGVHTYDLDGVRCIQCGAFKQKFQEKCPALISGGHEWDGLKSVCIHCGIDL